MNPIRALLACAVLNRSSQKTRSHIMQTTKNSSARALGLFAMLAALFLAASALAQITYNQALTATFTSGANAGADKNATTAPNDFVTFSNAVAAAHGSGFGGVFDLPTTVAGSTTVFRGTYAGGVKRLQFTTSVNMQNATAGGGSFTPTSGGNLTTSSANQSSIHLRIGQIMDPVTELPISEAVSRIGFMVLSRTAAAYPLDIRATASYSDGSTEAVTANLANPRAVDDTFYGFTAPSGLFITNVLLQSFQPGTENPVADRIGLDDIGFMTQATDIPPPPAIYDINPANYAIHAAANGVQFQVQSHEALNAGSISLLLNESDVTAQLVISGEATNRSVSFSGLVADQEYTMVITATNSGGASSVVQTFYTATGTFTLYDSQGFSDDELYPFGPLQAVTHDRATWAPNADEPAEIVDAGAPQGKALERLNTGIARADFLNFPPVSSGTILIEFDAWVSTTLGRTIDVALQPLIGANTMASFLSWGGVTEKLAYFDNVNWLPLADLETGWHHCKIINYLSGPAAGHYDVLINDTPVGLRIPWRNAPAGSAFGRFRYRSENVGPVLEYGRIDNLVLTAAQEDTTVFLRPTIFNVAPANRAIIRPQDGIRFEVTSDGPLSASDVTLLLDGAPVALDITGSPNHLFAAYNQVLAVGNHTMDIFATNAAGTASATLTFIATDEAWLVDPADGWVGPWEWSSGQPDYRTQDPIDGAGPYLRLDTGGGARNFMRQYESGTNVDVTKAHYIRWKFRLAEDDFVSNFTAFGDRVHFFGRNAARLTGSTDGGINWSIMATGAEQSAGSGVSAGQTFWIFDNVDGTGNLNLGNYVNTGVPLIPHHTYSFTVHLDPDQLRYSVAITNETSDAWFTSAAAHRYRNLTVPGADHTYVHFGVQASPSDEIRPFDLDSVGITQATLPAILLDPQRSGGAFTFSFVSQSGVTHHAEYANEIPPLQWHPVQTIAGDGSVKSVTDSNATGTQRYYRVRTQ
jgi:hypothetical protein